MLDRISTNQIQKMLSDEFIYNDLKKDPATAFKEAVYDAAKRGQLTRLNDLILLYVAQAGLPLNFSAQHCSPGQDDLILPIADIALEGLAHYATQHNIFHIKTIESITRRYRVSDDSYRKLLRAAALNGNLKFIKYFLAMLPANDHDEKNSCAEDLALTIKCLAQGNHQKLVKKYIRRCSRRTQYDEEGFKRIVGSAYWIEKAIKGSIVGAMTYHNLQQIKFIEELMVDYCKITFPPVELQRLFRYMVSKANEAGYLRDANVILILSQFEQEKFRKLFLKEATPYLSKKLPTDNVLLYLSREKRGISFAQTEKVGKYAHFINTFWSSFQSKKADEVKLEGEDKQLSSAVVTYQSKKPY